MSYQDFASGPIENAKLFLQTQGISKSELSDSQIVELANSKIDKMNLNFLKAAILQLLHDRNHDDGSWGPMFIRLAWHCCGTQDKNEKNGGSNGGTMRFESELSDPENAGLRKAVNRLNPLQKKFPWMTHADIQVQAGQIAIEESQGPKVPFSQGRYDFSEDKCVKVFGKGGCPYGHGKINPSKSRLPPADLGANPEAKPDDPMAVKEKPTIDGMRNTFSRIGMDDRESVVLIILGHQQGRCHAEYSGQEHPWQVFGPTEQNIQERGLGQMSVQDQGFINRQKEVKSSGGKRQFNFQMGQGEPFMMLPSDMALNWDEKQRKIVSEQNRDRRRFKPDAIKAWKKLTELGCDRLIPEEG